MRDIPTIAPQAGGSVAVSVGINAIILTVTGPLSPGSTGVVLDRAEAEAVEKALGVALARLRGDEARPSTAEPLKHSKKASA